jgi:hypothetical protein
MDQLRFGRTSISNVETSRKRRTSLQVFVPVLAVKNPGLTSTTEELRLPEIYGSDGAIKR